MPNKKNKKFPQVPAKYVVDNNLAEYIKAI